MKGTIEKRVIGSCVMLLDILACVDGSSVHGINKTLRSYTWACYTHAVIVRKDGAAAGRIY
jgi:hypothetical protein